MQPIRTALASFGLSGRIFHAPFLRVSHRFEVVSVLERTSNRATPVFPSAVIRRSYEELLSDESVELVIVNTPDTLHFDMCKGALTAGKHVVVEKPFVTTMEQARELVRIALEKNLCLTVYQNRRFDGDFLSLRDALQSGLLGEVIGMQSGFELYRPVDSAVWREDPGLAGGAITNFGSHILDQALALFGRPNTVTAVTEKLRPGTEVDDYFQIILGYDSKVVNLHGSYMVHAPSARFRVHGTEASWVKYGMDPQEAILKKTGGAGFSPSSLEPEEAQLIRVVPSGWTESAMNIKKGNYSRFYEILYDSIRNGGTPPVTTKDALLDMEVLEAAVRSAREERSITL